MFQQHSERSRSAIVRRLRSARAFLFCASLFFAAGLGHAQQVDNPFDEVAGKYDDTPPAITDFQVIPVSDTSVWVGWTTDEESIGAVEYGTTPAYGSTIFTGAAWGTLHVVQLDGLELGTEYHFRIVVTDVFFNLTFGGDETFTTPGGGGGATLSGEQREWFVTTLDVQGPASSESAENPNPFLDYRYEVRFTGPSGQVYDVPGFFDGDGTGGGSGDVWRVRFVPDEAGSWDYRVSFHEGDNIALNLDLNQGATLDPHGLSGSFSVAPRDPSAPGFRRFGRLEYVGEHYMKFRDGPYFLKGGTDSPENLFGFKGFDNTFDQSGGVNTSGLSEGLHRYSAHVGDYESGDPLFQSADHGDDSRGLIGALNYLSDEGVNSIYFLPMNLGGDGRDTCPFVGYSKNSYNKTHYDISKLRQWNDVILHAQDKGILTHFVLAETETENENWLDEGGLGTERKLFYRELIARFGHSLALKWNLSEENDYSTAEVRDFAGYIRGLDPYDHPIAFHTQLMDSSGDYPEYDAVLGDDRFSATSLHLRPEHASDHVEKWRTRSANAGRRWVADVDEQYPASGGLSASNADERRRTVLYDVYFSGGQVEWYFGAHALPVGGDLTCEDFRTREDMWEYMRYAREFMEDYLPFWEMEPMDELVSGETQTEGGGEVFAKPGDVYAVYYPSTSDTGSFNLSGASGSYRKRWFNPRTGSFEGPTETISGGSWFSVESPPSTGNLVDWVMLLERQ